MICVIDYGMGNLRSVSKALEKQGGEVAVSSHPRDLEKADKLVLPGVGAFGHGMQELKKRKLVGPLRASLLSGKPFLGICLGMQLLFEEGEESPGVAGLGVFPGNVPRFKSRGVKIPHMGWNAVKILRPVPILKDIPEGSFFYFLHSFYPAPRDTSLVAATCKYGDEAFAAVVGQGSIWSTQFHPEKSQKAGLDLLRNFVLL